MSRDIQKIRAALNEAYEALGQNSRKYRNDYERFVFTISLIYQIPNVLDLKILDVGSGIGIVPIALRSLGCKVEGLDLYIFPENNDDNDDRYAIKKIKNLKQVWSDYDLTVHNGSVLTEFLSKEIGTFDIVLSEATLEHQKDPKLFLTSCCNLTKDGGSYLVTTPNSVKLLQRFRFLFGRSPNWNIEDFFECGESFTGHWREYTMKELVYMCTKTGFSVEETYNVNVIASFRNLSFSRKNFNALVVRISGLFPGTREMNYLLCKKLMCNR